VRYSQQIVKPVGVFPHSIVLHPKDNCYKKKFKTKDFSGKISKTSATLPQ
jgi:hypothetical protein